MRPTAKLAFLALTAALTACAATAPAARDPFGGGGGGAGPAGSSGPSFRVSYDVQCFVRCSVTYTGPNGNLRDVEVEQRWQQSLNIPRDANFGSVMLRIRPGAGDQVRRASIFVNSTERARMDNSTSETVTLRAYLR